MAVLVIFPVILHTVINLGMLSIGGQVGNGWLNMWGHIVIFLHIQSHITTTNMKIKFWFCTLV